MAAKPACSASTRVLVVRHYKTVNNEAQLIMGWADAPRAKGWEQDLAYVAEVLQDSRIEVDRVYSSRLKRARHTAMYYAHIGLRQSKDQTTASKALNEINYGPQLSNKSKAWVAKNLPLHKKSPDFVYPGGESFAEMQRRSAAFVEQLAAANVGGTLMLVVHAGVIRGLVSHFLGLDYAANLTRRLGHRYIGDFTIIDGRCSRYDELGVPSGFVRDGVFTLPWYPRP